VVVNISSVPLFVLWTAEAASWVFLLVRMLIVQPHRLRGRVVAGVIIGVVLIQVLGLARGLPQRTVALMAIAVSLSLALSTLVLRRLYRKYLDAQEEYGPRTPQARKAANPLAFAIIGVLAVVVAALLVIFKGVTL